MLAQIVLDGGVFVELAVLADELVPFGIVQDVFVVSATPLGAVGFHAADDLGGGQAKGGHVFGVIDPARNDR